MAHRNTHPPAPIGIEAPHLEPGNVLSRHASPISLLVLSMVMAIGVSGLLGKPTTKTTVHDAAAELAIDMPAAVRNGDSYETRIRIKAKQAIGKLQVEVSPALWREITVNSMMPSPASEDFKGGYFRFEFASVDAGDAFLLKVASQVNPRLLGSLSGHIRVLDDGVVLVDAERTMKVLPLMEVVLRATAMFAVVYLLVRLLGKRELGQMTPFEFIVMVVIGDLIQQGVTQNDFSLTGATLAISTFAFWGLVMSWLSYLSPRAAKVLEGEPRVIIRHGELLQHSTRRDRLTRSEIESEMRLAGIASMDEVAWAVLEPNGKISFIKRPDGAEPSRQTDDQPVG